MPSPSQSVTDVLPQYAHDPEQFGWDLAQAVNRVTSMEDAEFDCVLSDVEKALRALKTRRDRFLNHLREECAAGKAEAA